MPLNLTWLRINSSYGERMTVLQFPADRRAADIKRCAMRLLDLHGEAANRFWRAEMAELAASLRAQGASETELSLQAGMFMQAVQAEMQRAYGPDLAESTAG
ncbi:DUF6074 family protein [Neorhizobium sp. SOG26]|uniref:DUF6074 family protein n=1 Tax=Neorhizobium sp. SOG26 TaxID=2060726 RepID=UPI004040B877